MGWRVYNGSGWFSLSSVGSFCKMRGVPVPVLVRNCPFFSPQTANLACRRKKPDKRRLDGSGNRRQGARHRVFFSSPQGNGRRIKRCYVPNRPAADSFSNNFLKKSKFLLQIEGNADIVPCGLMLFFYTLFNGSGRRLIILVLFN